MIDVSDAFEWLVQGARGATTPAEVVRQLCAQLVAAGVPLAGCRAFVRSLHPHVLGRSFTWRPGSDEVQVEEHPYQVLSTPEWKGSPTPRVFESGEWVRAHPGDPAYPSLQTFWDAGMTEYTVFPMRFLTGQTNTFAVMTRAPGGFAPEAIEALKKVMEPLARIAEILALARSASNILSTYVGRNAGDRILAGQIQRGDTETIRAVIWFSDLRGFTSLSASVLPLEIISTLNELFDCQVPHIEGHGGEVLKFMGDGMLAIFPLLEGTPHAKTCEGAIVAAEGALSTLEDINSARARAGKNAIRFGLALHLGEVAYGNIGGMNRLDFTAIGPAVNLASRLEGLTGKLALEKPLVVSAQLAASVSSRKFVSLGKFELKGVPNPEEVFALAD